MECDKSEANVVFHKSVFTYFSYQMGPYSESSEVSSQGLEEGHRPVLSAKRDTRQPALEADVEPTLKAGGLHCGTHTFPSTLTPLISKVGPPFPSTPCFLVSCSCHP